MRFQIKHGLFLKSAGKLLTPNTFYVTEVEAEIEELRTVFAEAVEEMKPPVAKAEKKPAEDTTVVPDDDITLAKGVGAGLSKKLAETGITTLSALKAAMLNPAREAEMKELLGNSHEKVLANFVDEKKEDSNDAK